MHAFTDTDECDNVRVKHDNECSCLKKASNDTIFQLAATQNIASGSRLMTRSAQCSLTSVTAKSTPPAVISGEPDHESIHNNLESRWSRRFFANHVADAPSKLPI